MFQIGGGEAANFPGDPSNIPVSSSQIQRIDKASEGRIPCFRKSREGGGEGGPWKGNKVSKRTTSSGCGGCPWW